MAEIPDAELKALLANNKRMAERLDALEGIMSPNGASPMRTLKRVSERIVEVRRVDGKVVVGYKNRGTNNTPQYIYTKPDPKDPTSRIEFVDIITEGMKEGESITLPLSEFRKESERVKCRVVETKELPWEKNQGLVKKREVDGYSTLEVDFDVPVDITGVIRRFVVTIPDQDQRQVTLDEKFVNIA